MSFDGRILGFLSGTPGQSIFGDKKNSRLRRERFEGSRIDNLQVSTNQSIHGRVFIYNGSIKHSIELPGNHRAL